MADNQESATLLIDESTPDDPESTLGNLCAGCVELTERVERLERLIEQIRPPAEAHPLSERRCYWICLSVHVFVLFMCSTTEALISVAYPLLLGSAVTWTICHVMVMRSFWQKSLRSTFSSGAIMLAAMLGLQVSDAGEFLELLPTVMVIVPATFAAGWFATSIYVWTVGWRVGKPDHSSQRQPLRIRDLFVLTFLVAAYLGAFRLFVAAELEEIWTYVGMSAYAMLPVFVVTLLTVPIARQILDQSRAVRVSPIAITVTVTVLLVTLGYCGAVVVIDESLDFQSMLMVSVLSTTAILMVFSSPILTFLLMRSAQYRLIRPQQAAGMDD